MKRNLGFKKIILSNRFVSSLLIFILMMTFLPVLVNPDFWIAVSGRIEKKPAAAYNSSTGEYLVAFLEEQTTLPGDPFNLRVKRYKNDLWQSTHEPLGTGTHEAIGRPAIAYSPNSNRFLVAVPERVASGSTYDRVIARFLAGNGNSLVGPDFLFDDVTNTYYEGPSVNGGHGSLQIAHNSIRDEFLVTYQRTVSGNNGVWAQRISYTSGTIGSPVQLHNAGLGGFQSHGIAYAPVAGTSPPGGRYLFTVDGGTLLLDANAGIITGIPLHYGKPEGNYTEADIAYGEVEGMKRFLLVYADKDNCAPGQYPCEGTFLEWDGVWGTYIDPEVTSYYSAINTPFPISKIPWHIQKDREYNARVTYSAGVKAFFVVFREIPVDHPLNDEILSHIRGTYVDYFVEDGLYGSTLVPDPHDNVVISDVTGSCGTLCYSNEDPDFPDVCPSGGAGAAVVWHQQWPTNPSDLDVKADFLRAQLIKNDFNKDRQADILWRHYGNGANVVWYIAPTGGTTGFSQDNVKIMSMDQDREPVQIYQDVLEAGEILYKDDRIYYDVMDVDTAYEKTPARVFWDIEDAGNVLKRPGKGEIGGDVQERMQPGDLEAGVQAISITGTAYLTSIADVNWRISGTGDFNGDGYMDILWRHNTTGKNALWYMNGSTIIATAYMITITDVNWKIVGTGYFNGDGHVDILWRHYGNGKNVVWYMNGGTLAGSAYLDAIADVNWKIEGTGDFNGDGSVDILWRHYTNGKNAVWYMNGTTHTGTIYMDTVTDVNWRIGGTGYFDGDDKVDILWRHYVYGTNSVWYMNGTTIKATETLTKVADTNWTIENH